MLQNMQYLYLYEDIHNTAPISYCVKSICRYNSNILRDICIFTQSTKRVDGRGQWTAVAGGSGHKKSKDAEPGNREPPEKELKEKERTIMAANRGSYSILCRFVTELFLIAGVVMSALAVTNCEFVTVRDSTFACTAPTATVRNSACCYPFSRVKQK